MARRWLAKVISIISICFFFLVIAGCSFGSFQKRNGSQNYEPFIAPTLIPTALPTETPLPTPLNDGETISELPGEGVQEGAAPSDCIDGLTYISDLTIPDGTVVVAGSTLDKQWEVENSGTCNWNSSYQIRLIAGSDLGAKAEQALIPARVGSRVTIRIVFSAPEEPGQYHSAWQAFNSLGNAFGDPIYIDIDVE